MRSAERHRKDQWRHTRTSADGVIMWQTTLAKLSSKKVWQDIFTKDGLVSRRTVDWITSWLHCWWPTQRRAVKSVTWSSQVWEALMRAATGSTALSLETKLIPLFTPQNVFCCSNRLFFMISCIFETVWSKQHCLSSSSSFLLIQKYSASSEWLQMFSFIFNLGSFLSILTYSLFI